MITTLLRIIKFAWQDFCRNIWLTLITITIITLTFASISLLFVFNDLTDTIIGTIQKKVDVSVYLKNTVTPDQIKQFQQYLQRIPEASEVVLISPEESLSKFKLKHQKNDAIVASLEELGENPLGATFIIFAEDIEDYPSVLNKIKKFPDSDVIADTNFANYQIIISRFNSFSIKTKQVGMVLSIIFGIITILIVFNTIRISIHTHQEEIGVMKLVGATNSFIQMPYLLEGIGYTVIAAILTYLLFYPLVNIAQPYIWQYFEGTFDLQTYFFNDFIKILAMELAGMIIINLVASSIAIRKYSKR